MRSEDLLKYISDVDDRFIDELFEENPASVKPVSKRKQWSAVAACIALVFLSAAVMLQNITNVAVGNTELSHSATMLTMATNSVVMIDVNPSIRLEVNDRGIVVASEALNEDAQNLTADTELVGKNVDAAVSETVKLLKEHEYITNLKNSLLLTILDADEGKAEQLRSGLVESISKLEDENDYSLSIISQTMTDESKYKELAENNHISSGRVMLIQQFCSEHTGYTFEDLVKYNIQTINQLLEYVGASDSINISGEPAGTVPDEYREKLGLEELNCEEMMNFICAISDFYNKLSEYYSESDVAKQIGYVFDIALGQTQNGEKLWAVIAESVTKNVGSHGAIINIGKNAVSDWYNQSTIHKVTQYIEKTYIEGRSAA